jgi:hypothetical protein
MARLAEDIGAHELTFETFGLRVRVVTDSAETLDRIPALLPPGWRPSSQAAVDTTFALRARSADKFALMRDGNALVEDWGRDVALVVLERELRLFLALEAPGLVFVHAGAVAHRGYVIVIPGKTYSGKTSLVAALVRAGAVYYSDEYAPLDEHGLVHPFAKPLSLRVRGGQTDHPVETLGGVAGHEPAPVGMVVHATYRPGAEWRPEQLSSGEAVLALLGDTIPAQTRPAECLRALTAATAGAVVLQGDRGEAAEVAPMLLRALEDALTECP